MLQIIKQGPSSHSHDKLDIIWKELVTMFCFLPKYLEKKKNLTQGLCSVWLIPLVNFFTSIYKNNYKEDKVNSCL